MISYIRGLWNRVTHATKGHGIKNKKDHIGQIKGYGHHSQYNPIVSMIKEEKKLYIVINHDLVK